MRKNNLLTEIKERIKKIEPSAEIWLYGSRANNSFHSNSDWDILILIDADHISMDEEHRITSPIYDLEFEFGQIISPFVYTKKQWQNKKITPFYKSVEKNHLVI